MGSLPLLMGSVSVAVSPIENITKIDHLAFTIFRGLYNINNLEKLETITDDVNGFTREKLAGQNLYRLIVQGYLSLFVILLGLVGNTINALVLSHRKMRQLPINCLFLGLSFSDSFLLLVFSFLVIPTILSYYEVVDYSTSKFALGIPILYVLFFVAHTMSVFFILLVTFERYMAVCHPLKPRLLCSSKRVLVASVGVVVLSFLFNSARWLEFEVIEQVGSRGQILYIPVTTTLRKNPTYEKYILLNYVLLNWLLPIGTTLVLNSLILCRIYTANKERKSLSQSQKNENQLSLMLLIVVGVFLVCNTLFLVNMVAKVLTGSTAVFGVDSMRNFLWIVNASVNFTIYCAYGKKFRGVFIEICKNAWGWVVGIPRRIRESANQVDIPRSNAVFYGNLTATNSTMSESEVYSEEVQS